MRIVTKPQRVPRFPETECRVTARTTFPLREAAEEHVELHALLCSGFGGRPYGKYDGRANPRCSLLRWRGLARAAYVKPSLQVEFLPGEACFGEKAW